MSEQSYVRIAQMLVLASGSPRRQKLLTLGGWDFDPQPVEIDETPFPGEEPGEYVLRLASQKARTAAAQVPNGNLVLAADTAVVDEDQILGKPASPGEAIEILERLRGRPHQVYTAIALLETKDGKLTSEVATTRVHMRDYQPGEVFAYVESGDPMDKAGAYAIQHPSFDPVERLEGCYTNVVGLPLCHLYRMLRKLDGPVPNGIPPLCQAVPPQPCQISPLVIAQL
jgi:MAF protein